MQAEYPTMQPQFGFPDCLFGNYPAYKGGRILFQS